MDEIDAVFAAALDFPGGLLVLPDELADDPLDGALLGLLLGDARADGGLVVVAALAVAEGGPGHGDHVFPQRAGQAGVRQHLADLARQHEALALGPPDDEVGDALQVGGNHGVNPQQRTATGGAGPPYFGSLARVRRECQRRGLRRAAAVRPLRETDPLSGLTPAARPSPGLRLRRSLQR